MSKTVLYLCWLIPILLLLLLTASKVTTAVEKGLSGAFTEQELNPIKIKKTA